MSPLLDNDGELAPTPSSLSGSGKEMLSAGLQRIDWGTPVKECALQAIEELVFRSLVSERLVRAGVYILLPVQDVKQEADAPNSDSAGEGSMKTREEISAGDIDMSDTSVCPISHLVCLCLFLQTHLPLPSRSSASLPAGCF